jgi:hypothetical protein
VRCRLTNVGRGSGSADFKHVADLPLAARCGLATSFCTFDLPLADVREDGAEVLGLDDRRLRNLPQLVEGGVGQAQVTLPSDLSGSLKSLDDTQLQRLLEAVTVEIDRRKQSAPKNETARVEQTGTSSRGGSGAIRNKTRPVETG